MNILTITDRSSVVEAVSSIIEIEMTDLEKGLKLLDIGVESSFVNPELLDFNLEIVDLGMNFLSPLNIPFLNQSARDEVIKNYLDIRILEKDVHVWFKNNIGKILGDNYAISDKKSNSDNIPDFWLLKDNNDYIPVEIKLHDFNDRSLKQLIRYINYYDCDKGIAIGKRLNCDLPDNIKFISFSENDIQSI